VREITNEPRKVIQKHGIARETPIITRLPFQLCREKCNVMIFRETGPGSKWWTGRIKLLKTAQGAFHPAEDQSQPENPAPVLCGETYLR